ncbi:MAG: hypothetical protein E6G97_22705 [Alphaproteobacteria bacterium]|nr:MAG: hypothetical protein E6G97_22705 [Alphaproteobacteria bacterium]
MPVPSRPISPEQMAEGRRLYEQTRMPVADIAAMMGIGARTFFTRVRQWGWRRRMSRIPLTDSPRTPADAAPAPPSPSFDAVATPKTTVALAERIERLVERELTAIESVIVRHGLDNEHTEQVERSARVLASLARTLQEVKRLDATDARRKDDNDRGPDDPDVFFQGLLRRLEEFAARDEEPLPGLHGPGGA